MSFQHRARFIEHHVFRQSGMTPISILEEGANVIRTVTSTELEGESGGFFDQLRRAKAHAQAYDAHARAQFRALSQQLAGIG
jgi:hypothetical protein